MRLHLLAVVAAGLLLAADKPKVDAKNDSALLEGSWKFQSAMIDGKRVPMDTFSKWKLVIKGNKFTLDDGESKDEGTIKIDPTKKPKQIDFTYTKGKQKGMTYHGIYEVDKFTCKVCFDYNGKDRPKVLASKKDSGHALQVLSKVKERK
jgi:uncharacterized protein (TIGR03067 family)